MNSGVKIGIGLALAFLIICAGTSLGSSSIGLGETLRALLEKILRLPGAADQKNSAIIWQLRLPRVLLAFMVGGCLSISGAAVQSILKNQLASPYTLGVSAGASLGAGIVIISGFSLPLISGYTLPAAGFVFGLVTVYAVIAFSARIDRTMSNNTIILCGMVFSLFVSALLTTLTAVFSDDLKRVTLWQMGSFALRGWFYVRLMLPFCVIGALGVLRYAREMDIMSFGEDEAKSVGVDARGVKQKLFLFSSILTGGAVSLSGTIGFVDLIAPHIARRLVGSKHIYVIPMSFITGGSLMVIADLIARTVISPSELPVGAITALIGAPFFAWVYFRKK